MGAFYHDFNEKAVRLKIYLVGGAVRDQLLGLPVNERDYVVVGATPEEMVARGFRPVGKDFPVFLHPQTNEEYALARTERKISKGYKGFAFHTATEVTLEQDLIRRDLTINAIAQDPEGNLIDPFGGLDDLKGKYYGTFPPRFRKTRYGFCGWRVLQPVFMILKSIRRP